MFIALVGAAFLAGCGNGDTTSQTTFNNGTGNQPYKPTTHLSHRSLVTNYYAGRLQVMDATENRLTSYTFSTGAQPTYMQSSPDGTLTFVNNTGANTISSFNNNLEAVKAAIVLGGTTQSFVTSQNNKVGYAAVPNYSNGSWRVPGAIVRFNPTDGSLATTQIAFPNVTKIGMDPGEKHLLAFTSTDNIAYWVDLTGTDPNTLVAPYFPLSLSDASGNAVTLSRPVAAFYSSDGSTAYILSCGLECGGTDNPSVVAISTSSLPTDSSTTTGTTVNATVTNVWSVSGARIGLIDTTAKKLYVAGSLTTSTANDCPFTGSAPTCTTGTNNVQDGFFTIIDLNAGTAGSPIRIGNGVKHVIRNINGTFWIGSLSPGVQSGVTMVTAAGAASVLPNANGDTTGIALQSNSSQVYTIEGGEFYMYNQQGGTVLSDHNTDVKGQAYDVLYID